MLKMLDLFSGIGGFSLAAHWTGQIETVAFCEIEEFPQKVLRKNFPGIPIFEDVRKLTREDIDEPIDIICGGYPCQPFSTAGKRAGAEDDRHLWPEVFRLLKEFRPTWFIGENVAGHISLGLDQVLSDLESENYSARTFVIPACAKNAPHRRDRVWVVANTNNKRREQLITAKVTNKQGQPCRGGSPFNIPSNTTSLGLEKSGSYRESSSAEKDKKRKTNYTWDGSKQHQWGTEPAVGRVANGIPRRVDRLKALGNAIVPQVAYEIFRAIVETEETLFGSNRVAY